MDERHSRLKMELFLGLGHSYPVQRKKQKKEAKVSSGLTAWGCRADGSPGWEAHFSGRTKGILASQGSEMAGKSYLTLRLHTQPPATARQGMARKVVLLKRIAGPLEKPDAGLTAKVETAVY